MKKTDIHIHASLQQEEQRPEAILEYLSHYGVTHGILMSMGEDNENGNPACLEMCKGNPDLNWNCNFDPVSPETVFARMAKYKEQGAIGVGELAINERIDHPVIESILDAAEKMELPVLFHMSPEVGYQYGIVDMPGLPLLEEALKKHPHLKFVGHSQVFWIEISKDAPTDNDGRYGRGTGKVVPGGRLVELFHKYDNLYGDISAGSGFCAITRDEAFGLWFIREFQDRLMFGTDTVSSKPQWEVPMWKWLEDMHACGKITDDIMEKICYKNAENVYGIRLIEDQETVLADTPCGKVKGLKKQGYHLFTGIPYATAERFQYPKEIKSWEGILDATRRGKCCYQIRTFLSEALSQDPFFYHEFRQGLHFDYGDACQNLNIRTDAIDENGQIPTLKPVIVYIHGGAFVGGSSLEKHLDGSSLCRKGAVVVTVNYRLGPFGFLCTSDGIKESGHTGNYGLYDQVEALKWIRHNIKAFGGDPEKITLMGQSAGAMCVQHLCISHKTKGLFQRAVLLSGTGYSDTLFESEATQTENSKWGDEVLAHAGCSTLAEFRALSAWEILSAFLEVLQKHGLGITSPVIDGELITSSIQEGIKADAMHPIPYIISSTGQDLWQPELKEAVKKLGQKCYDRGNKNVYLAYFKRMLPGDDKGAFHTADLWYWMGSLTNAWRPFTEEDLELSQRMQAYLLSFARTGDPNCDGCPNWHPADEKTVLELDVNME